MSGQAANLTLNEAKMMQERSSIATSSNCGSASHSGSSVMSKQKKNQEQIDHTKRHKEE